MEFIMYPFRNILVAVAGEHPSQAVMGRATRLAEQDEASIKIVTVVEDLPWYTRWTHSTAKQLQELIIRDRDEALTRFAEPLARAAATASTEVLRDRPQITMVREVLRDGHDLLLKEAEPNENVLFGSIDMHLLRTCPCPVWLVKPGQGDGPFSRILAPVDPAPPPDETDLLHLKQDLDPKDPALDAKILELAGSLADSVGAELHVLHVWSTPGEGFLRGDAMLTQEQVERYVEDSRAAARKALDCLLAASPDQSGRRFVHLLKGEPAEVITEFAKTG